MLKICSRRGCARELAALMTAFTTMVCSASAAPRVLISQAYGAGGQSASFPNADYVELLNTGDLPQDLTGWSLQVSQGSDLAPWTVIPLTGSIPPGQFYLVQVTTAAATGTPLPTPDVVNPGAAALLFSTDGRVALVRNTTPLTNTPCPAVAPINIADFVVWGTIYSCAEVTQAPATTVTTAIFRQQGGCLDANNNSTDFATAAPQPRNSSRSAYVFATSNPGNPIQGTNLVILTSRQQPALVPCVANFGAIVTATADLTAIGGPADFVLDDNGGDDDGTGDGLFGATTTVSPSVAPGQYVIPVSASDGVKTLTTSVAITVRPGPPANDLCAGAVNLGSLDTPYIATIDNSTAQVDANPVCGGTSMAFFGVWYRFDAPASGVLRLRETSSQDVVYGVYQTPNCALSTSITCSNADDVTSVNVTEGLSYLVLVGSAPNTTPSVSLALNFSFVPRPANDECIAATDLGGLTSTFSGMLDNAAALDDTDVTCNSGTATRFGAWYTFVPATNGAIVLTETSAQDAVYGLFTGTCGNLTAVACQSADNPAIIPGLIGGTRYFVLLGNQGSSTSPPTIPFTFTFTFAPNPLNDTCETAHAVSTFPFTETPYPPPATDDIDVSCNAANNTMTRKGVWYAVTTGLDSGRLIMTESSVNDLVFALFDGPACNQLGTHVCSNEAAAAAGVRVAAGRTYRLLVGLNSATALPSLPYSIGLDFVADSGACCTSTGCVILSASACAMQNGVFRGADTTCIDVPRYLNTVGAIIPDYDGTAQGPELLSTIVVPAADTTNVTSSLAVRVALAHAAGGDLTIRLTGPDDTTVDLVRRAGAAAPCALNSIGTLNDLSGVYIFSDAAPTTLAAALAAGPSPLAPGAYRPSGCNNSASSLNAAFVGHPVAGTWTLQLVDESAGIAGSIQNWGLVIDGFETPCPSGACCVATSCSVTGDTQCSRLGGVFSAGIACAPQSCGGGTGACCRGSVCSTSDAAACTGFATSFAGAGTVCNVFGTNNDAPCCLADYNHDASVTVQDIFDFLFGYFNNQPGANVNGLDGITVQDIFDYLFLYFQGQCM